MLPALGSTLEGTELRERTAGGRILRRITDMSYIIPLPLVMLVRFIFSN